MNCIHAATTRVSVRSAKSVERIQIQHGSVQVVSRKELKDLPVWKNSFADQRKDNRYYEIIAQTLTDGFEYHYFVLDDRPGSVRAIQPFFLVDQDLVAGLSGPARSVVGLVRRVVPRLLRMKTLMVGCVGGEGHLCFSSAEDTRWIAESLHEALHEYARRVKVPLVVLKEFPSAYRPSLRCFSNNGYTRIPSMPMVRLNIDFADFDEYMRKVLSKSARRDLRRKFKKAAHVDPIRMEVVNDLTPYIDEVYPLYLQVYQRSKLHFEKLTKEYLCQLGQQMPDRARFFIWRQNDKAVAFSVCMVHDAALHDEYIGLDYAVALDLHLYFYTLRDIIQWAMDHGCTTYYSSCLNYAPKLHMRCELVPLDLYVHHTWPLLNQLFGRLLPLLAPTRHDRTLHRFPNAHEL
jgi:hypothetical protein